MRQISDNDSVTEEQCDDSQLMNGKNGKYRKSILSNVVGFIIVTEFCERVAYYGFAGSLVLFFQMKMNMSNAEADVQFSYWSGMSCITPLIGGYVADTYLGRYYTILVFCMIYLLGLSLVVVGSLPGDSFLVLVLPGLYIGALGGGGIKPNVSTLGADQFDMNYAQDRKEKESFFNWFYWSVNLGSAVSYTLVAYVCQYGIPALGGQKWGFFDGYLISALMMGVGILIFLSGTAKYKVRKPTGSVVATAMKIVFEACSSYVRESVVSIQSYFSARPTLTASSPRPVHVLDRAKAEYGGTFSTAQVNDIKMVAKLTPFLVSQIPYWGIYSQMSTAFQNQGCQMDLTLNGALIPVSALNLFDTLAIILLVPIFDQVLYPMLKRAGLPLTMLYKIGAGFICALVSMLVAAGLEQARLSYAPTAGDYYDASARDNISPCQNLDDFNPYVYQQYFVGQASKPAYCSQICDLVYNSTSEAMLNMSCISCQDIPQMSRISILWQIPQFALVGISEILTSVTALDFFFSEAPADMKSVTQSLNLFTIGMGSLSMVPLIYIVNSNPDNMWVPVNVDEGHLIAFFLLLAGLMAVGMIYFWYISKDYKYNSDTGAVDGDEGGTSVGQTEERWKDDGFTPNPMVTGRPGLPLAAPSYVQASLSDVLEDDADEDADFEMVKF